MPFKPKQREYRARRMESATVKEEAGKMILEGMPIVFGVATPIWKSYDGTVYYEKIDRHALDECDFSDFIFNRNHGENDGTVFARNRNGSLQHSITEKGMTIRAELDEKDDRHCWLYGDVESGRVDKMSFSFSDDYEYQYDTETHTRTITKIKKLYDVSAVDFPAYEEAVIQTARSFFGAEHDKELKGKELALRKKRLAALLYL